MKKVGVLLSGSGVFDGSEIHETVFTLLALDEHDIEAVCMAPDVDQHHVVNHLTGDEMPETRNVLVESARIARGSIQRISEANLSELEGLMIPGGFGTAKNHTKWAFQGPDGEINPEVRDLIRSFVQAGKPIAALCMGPTTVAKALEGTGIQANLTVGTTEESSPYEIDAISQGMEKAGAVAEMKSVREITIDAANKIVSAPCYMMEARVREVRENIRQATDALAQLLEA